MQDAGAGGATYDRIGTSPQIAADPINILLAQHMLARTLLVTTLLGLLVHASPAAAASAPPGVIRAAIQPPATRLATEEVRQPKLVAIHCLATLLHERLLSRPGLLLVDPRRSATN